MMAIFVVDPVVNFVAAILDVRRRFLVSRCVWKEEMAGGTSVYGVPGNGLRLSGCLAVRMGGGLAGRQCRLTRVVVLGEGGGRVSQMRGPFVVRAFGAGNHSSTEMA